MKIKTIDINAKEWFDRINGNSYFSGNIIINYKLKDEDNIDLPFQYGYGDHYVEMSKELIFKKYNLTQNNKQMLWAFCNDNKIILRTNIQRNCLRRELRT